MKIIKSADKMIVKVWGAGKVKPGCYRQMTYTIPVSIEEGTLLHNSVTGELILLDPSETAQLSTLPCDYAPWMDRLIQKHYLVRMENDDEKTVHTLRTAMCLSKRTDKIRSYVVLPTTHCNARCFYCFESNDKQHLHMTDETADQLVKFMADHRGEEKLSIRWFGGEPLISVSQIDRISATLKAKNIPFSSTMISNGYLITQELAKRIRTDWNLTGIQITLDGTEQIYNQTKNYRNPSTSPYQQVLHNIEMLLDNGIRVSVRLNLGLHNAEDLTLLIDELGERFYGKKGFFVYAHLLFEGCGFEPTHFDSNLLLTMLEKQETMNNRIKSLSFSQRRVSLPSLRFQHCMVDKDDWLVVLPSGHLTKCEHYTDRHYIGHIETGITDQGEWNLIRERMIYPHCSACPLYPSCIKVKLCEDDRTCNEVIAKVELSNTIRNICSIYEASLHDDRNAADMEKRNAEKGE